jgi:hypothetical protein
MQRPCHVYLHESKILEDKHLARTSALRESSSCFACTVVCLLTVRGFLAGCASLH